MLTATVACPSCSGSMPLTAWNPGRQIRCPRCKATFRLGSQPGDVALVLAQGPTTPTPAIPVPTPAVGQPTVPRSSTSPAPISQPTGALDPAKRRTLILAVLGGLLLFVGGTVGLAILVARLESSPAPLNENSALTQNTGNGPTPGTNFPQNPVPPGPEQPGVENPPVGQPAAPPVPVRRLPPELQEKVDQAIEKGVGYLQSYIREDGTLRAQVSGYPDGMLFLVGLTLLECGVPPAEARMNRLTERVRAYARAIRPRKTYELSLALLYLDKLADPSDRPLLQKMGLQLLAGQLQGGGWTYDCQQLSTESEKQLLVLLERTRPEKASELILRDSGGRYLDLGGKLIQEDDLQAGSIKNLEVAADKLQSIQDELTRFPDLRRVVSLQGNGNNRVPGRKGRPRTIAISHGPGDNSNTQFAALGLWAASRHGIPCERSLALLSARFRTSQGPRGGWGYHPGAGETPAMTCAGLLALAIGHGVRVGDANDRQEDPQIQKGLQLLEKQITQTPEMNGLYFIWSLERVGVLFNLEKVGDIDWYRLGAERLVPRQSGEGFWLLHNYHGSHQLTDTSFALLFLRKANFVQDLSNKLENLLDIKGKR